jgi:hypothetical protein
VGVFAGTNTSLQFRLKNLLKQTEVMIKTESGYSLTSPSQNEEMEAKRRRIEVRRWAKTEDAT